MLILQAIIILGPASGIVGVSDCGEQHILERLIDMIRQNQEFGK